MSQPEALSATMKRSHLLRVVRWGYEVEALEKEIAELRKSHFDDGNSASVVAPLTELQKYGTESEFERLAHCLDAMTGALPVNAPATKADQMFDVITARVAELRRDRERLDWFDKYARKDKTITQITWDGSDATLRQAIDAAMKATAEAKEK